MSANMHPMALQGLRKESDGQRSLREWKSNRVKMKKGPEVLPTNPSKLKKENTDKDR